MHPVVVHAPLRNPPYGVADLSGPAGTRPGSDALVAAGQALTWRAPFTCGPHTAVPLAGAAAVLVDRAADPGAEQWHDRFVRGLIHRLAGELTVISMTAGLLGETARDDAEPIGSAVSGLTRLVDDMNEARRHDESADRIVADTIGTHAALLGEPAEQDVSVRERDGFTVNTVRSVFPDLAPDEVERARSRIGLPWPARVGGVVGGHVGLARWRESMEAAGDRMWCRLDADGALVTELWLRHGAVAAESSGAAGMR